MNQQAAKACALTKHGGPAVHDRDLRISGENEQVIQERGQKAGWRDSSGETDPESKDCQVGNSKVLSRVPESTVSSKQERAMS